MEANEFTPLSDSPVPQATAAKELSADMELAAIEGRVAIARDVSPDHPDVSPKELWGWYMVGIGR